MIHQILQFILHFRILPRSSSLREPRDPSLKGVFVFSLCMVVRWYHSPEVSVLKKKIGNDAVQRRPRADRTRARDHKNLGTHSLRGLKNLLLFCCCNDPSAGSPTETLLRLLLPLDSLVCKVSPAKKRLTTQPTPAPIHSPTHPIGRSDGRCVQRAGTYSLYINDVRLLGIPRSRAKITMRDSNHDGISRLHDPLGPCVSSLFIPSV